MSSPLFLSHILDYLLIYFSSPFDIFSDTVWRPLSFTGHATLSPLSLSLILRSSHVSSMCVLFAQRFSPLSFCVARWVSCLVSRWTWMWVFLPSSLLFTAVVKLCRVPRPGSHFLSSPPRFPLKCILVFVSLPLLEFLLSRFQNVFFSGSGVVFEETTWDFWCIQKHSGVSGSPHVVCA